VLEGFIIKGKCYYFIERSIDCDGHLFNSTVINNNAKKGRLKASSGGALHITTIS